MDCDDGVDHGNGNVPFSKTTDPMVNQKNAPGQLDESNMAMATVPMKTITSARMLYTMRGVKVPLKV